MFRICRLAMLKPYIVYYKYKTPANKGPGAVKQYRIYAASTDEAKRLASQFANYPHIEILDIKHA